MLNRTQIMLGDKIKHDLKYLSENTGKSMSELVRTLLAGAVAKEINLNKKKLTSKSLLLKIDKYAVHGPGTAEEDMDKYIYGIKK
jgi:hypothetical protein